MKVSICGLGAVGQAHYDWLKDLYSIEVYDPPKGYNKISKDIDCAIICVSTPSYKDGSCLMDNVFTTIDALPDVPILIKSTISVEGWEMLTDAFPNRSIVFSPEFLRANTALVDLQDSKMMILGGEYKPVEFWINFFRNVNENMYYQQCSPKEAILIKYFRNSFLATKVSFFNQVHDLCEQLNIPFHTVQRGITDDTRIGLSHSNVTTERGYGGHCFPKDVKAIIQTGLRNNTNLSILEEIDRYNENITNRK